MSYLVSSDLNDPEKILSFTIHTKNYSKLGETCTEVIDMYYKYGKVNILINNKNQKKKSVSYTRAPVC